MVEQILLRLEDIEPVRSIEGRVRTLTRVDDGYEVTLGAYRHRFHLPEVEAPLGNEENTIRNSGRIKIYSEDLGQHNLPSSVIDDFSTRLLNAGAIDTSADFGCSGALIRAKGYEVFFPNGQIAYRHAEDGYMFDSKSKPKIHKADW